jgi:hypothetical protein
MIAATVAWYAALLVFVQMQTGADGDRLPAAAGFLAEPCHDLGRGHPDAHAGEHFRGRVMGVRMMVIYGLPLGLLAAGSLIEAIGLPPPARLRRCRDLR